MLLAPYGLNYVFRRYPHHRHGITGKADSGDVHLARMDGAGALVCMEYYAQVAFLVMEHGAVAHSFKTSIFFRDGELENRIGIIFCPWSHRR